MNDTTRKHEPPGPAVPPRRWLQFGLRAFLLATTVVALTVAWFAIHVRWLRDRRAAIEQLAPFRGDYYSEHTRPGDPESRQLPPRSLRWLGETRGLAKIRLEPNPDDPDPAGPLQKKLASLFPEALVWIAPDDPAQPDPLFDDPAATREKAFTFKVRALADSPHIESHKDRRLIEVHRQAADLGDLERRHRLVLKQQSDLQGSNPARPASGLPQRLGVEHKLLRTELALAKTKAGRIALLESHRHRLAALLETLGSDKSGSPTIESDLLACESATLLAGIELARESAAGTLSDAEVEFQIERCVSRIRVFQQINALYVVGARGGEAELWTQTVFDMCQARSTLARSYGNDKLALGALRLAATAADEAAAAYHQAIERLGYSPYLVRSTCSLLRERALVKLELVRWDLAAQNPPDAN